MRVRGSRGAGRGAVLLLAAAAGLVGCGPSPAADPTAPGEKGRTLTVLAAASLRGAFTVLADDFERTHPGTDVVLSFGPSTTLAAQVVQGVPADVIATASDATMAAVTDAGLAPSPTTFAVNRLAVVTPSGSNTVSSLTDLSRSDVAVAICEPTVPCGAAAERLFQQQDLVVTPVTEEADVSAVLTKVTLGEVDAGVVYVTDVLLAGPRVREVAIPPGQNVTTNYPIVALTDAPDPGSAAEFVALVLSTQGRRVLSQAGFEPP